MTLKSRDHSIDALRGIAIFIMIFANTAPYILPEPHGFYFRAIDSYAAPIFIALAAFGLSLRQDAVNLKIFNKKLFFRGLLTLLIAVLIDVFTWGIMPFIGYDVLYLIGFCLMLAAFLEKISNVILIISAFLILGLTFYFQNYLAYPEQIEDVKFDINQLKVILKHFGAFLSYGWFPIFPWLAVFLLAYLGGKFHPRFGRLKHIISTVLVVVFSLTLIFIFHQNKIVRDGYSELFYPADLLFCIHIIAFLFLIWINRSIFNHKIYKIFWVIGKSSMFIYILHGLIISNLIPLIYDLTDKNHWTTYLVFYAIIYAIAFLLDYIKKSTPWKKTPYLVRFIFGS